MPGVWESMKKAAMTGVAHVAVSAEQAARRAELERRIGQAETGREAHYAALGRIAAAAVRSGVVLQGAEEHVAGAEAAEAAIAALQAELHRLGGSA